jgi:Ni/Fe-hydrogenase subunit HybB-like protein
MGTPYPLTQAARALCYALGVAGLLAFGVGLSQSPARAWAAFLLGNVYFVSLALFGVVFVAMTHVVGAGWAVLFRRVPEAFARYLPVGAVLMLALYPGLGELYEWARPSAVAASPHLQHKAAYLNPVFFFLRMVAAFGLWIYLSHRIVEHSRRQDVDGDLIHTRKSQTLSTLFLALFALTFTYSSFDWIMSLEPDWYSTLFPLYLATGLFLGGTAAMILLVLRFRERGALRGVTGHHRYELVRLLCAASTAWVFIAGCQYLLIYYTNIPEEAVYYVRRFAGGGHLLFLLNMVLSGLLPLVLLLPPRARHSARWLARACALVLVGRWLDLWLLIVPAVSPGAQISLLDVVIPLGFVPLFLFPVIAAFRQAEPVPRQDPYLVESAYLRAM